MKRAYSRLEISKMWDEDEDKDVDIEGMATTPTPDRMSDIVDPMGAKFASELPLLWQHDHSQPVGRVSFGKPTKSGIPFKARIPRVKEAGRLKERIDEALQSLKYKLVGAVSIGFNVNKDGLEWIDDTGGLKYTDYELLELSLVTIPANAEATISNIKSLDRQARAASGKQAKSIALISSRKDTTRKGIPLIPRTEK